jgi:hypothetical protein
MIKKLTNWMRAPPSSPWLACPVVEMGRASYVVRRAFRAFVHCIPEATGEANLLLGKSKPSAGGVDSLGQ